MPILLPVLVRRSVRSSTVAATRPTELPALTERQNSTQLCTPQPLQEIAVFVERMARQEEADRVVFAAAAASAAGQGS